jgi:hypothetical protein
MQNRRVCAPSSSTTRKTTYRKREREFSEDIILMQEEKSEIDSELVAHVEETFYTHSMWNMENASPTPDVHLRLGEETWKEWIPVL